MKYTMTIFNAMRVGGFAATHRACYRRYHIESEKDKKEIHPYHRIHPWESENEFAKNLLKNVIYNADGIVAINKPYGISVYLNKNNSKNINFTNNHHKIVKMANYNIEQVLPYLAKELDVSTLIPCTGSDKFMTGIHIFGTNKKACEDINLAQKRAIHMKQFKKYWAITTRIPNILKGQYHLAMRLKVSPEGNKKPVIMTTWSSNAEKRKDIKILNINYKFISNSTHNLASLIELDASTKKWHCLRLFAATMLYSPLLGDNYHGSRVQELMGTWVNVNPFADSCNDMPVINQNLLKLLNISRNQQEIIPCHNHLRSIFLRSYGKRKTNILIEAPLIDPFNWTCKQLMFKDIPYE